VQEAGSSATYLIKAATLKGGPFDSCVLFTLESVETTSSFPDLFPYQGNFANWLNPTKVPVNNMLHYRLTVEAASITDRFISLEF
jgi:hypothetical protein